jgi:hypothetical protein
MTSKAVSNINISTQPSSISPSNPFPLGSTNVNDNTEGGSFLDRERALLGDDADQFTTVEDTKLATVEDADEDLLGDSEPFQGDAQFESAFPEIESTTHDISGVTVTGSAPTSYPAPAYTEPEPEPEVITRWREKRDEDVAKRDTISAERKEKTVNEAREAIDDFYDNYNDKKERNIAQTRREAEEFLASRDDTTAGGTSWERIAKLVDLSKGGAKGAPGTAAGKERFREMLLSLRKDEKAPGASGL